MQKLKKALALLCLLAISIGALGIQVRASDEGENLESLTEKETLSESSAEVVAAESRTVPSGYADMRVGKMTDDGFIKSDGIYAEYYYSARWHGTELSSEDTTLAMGQVTYCINPDIPLVGTAGDEAYGWIGSKDVIRNLTSSRITAKGVIFRMLGRVLQVGGTDLKDGSELAVNAAEGTKYVATQMIIWQIVWGDMDADFNLLGSTWKKFGWEGMKYFNTAPAGGKSVKAWYDQWIAELKNSKKIPSFASTASATAPTHEMTDAVLTLTDSNHVLQYMRFTPSDASVKLTVSGNQLKIDNPNRVDFSVTVVNSICEGAKEPTPIMARRLGDDEPRQTNIVVSRTALDDPVKGFFNIKAAPATGDLLIQKQVEQDEMLTSGLAGYQFRVQSTQTGYSALHETDANGEIRISGLKKGTYTVEEVIQSGINQEGSNFQFEIPDRQTVEVGATQGAVTQVKFQNRLRRGDLTIFKVDAVSPSTKLAGVKLLLEKKVYYSAAESVPAESHKDENGYFYWKTVSEQTTGEGGKAMWGNLTVGEYRLTETKAAPGYQLLAEPVVFSLPYVGAGASPEWSYVSTPVSISQELTLGDQPIYVMPSSGGWEAWLYIAGFALCAAGIGARKITFRKQQGENL